MRIFGSKENSRSPESFLIEEGEILSDLAEKKGTSLFLGKYTLNEVSAVLKKRNFFKDAKKRELWPIVFELDSSEFPLQRFQIFFQSKKPENLIVDLKIKKGRFRPKETIGFPSSLPEFNFLAIEWLTLQNPLLQFSEDKTPLPGQNYPGLNLGKKVMDLFVYLARLNRDDGILAYPAYFHNALLFSRSFHFINPEKNGEILAIRRSLRDVPFKHLAWIVHLNCLKEKGRGAYEWKAEEQVYALNKVLKDYFDSKKYKEKVKAVEKRRSYFIDWECYKKKQKQPE